MDIQRFDALVVGAGMGGATAAAHLATRPGATGSGAAGPEAPGPEAAGRDAAPARRVALIEAESSAGYHTTGRSAAIWIGSYGSPDAVALTLASRAFFEAPPPGFAGAPLMLPRPVLHLATEAQRATLDAFLSATPGVEPISADAARALVPALRPGHVAAAAIERDAFDMDVAALHAGFLAQLRDAGGVLALRRRAGRIWRRDGLWHAETTGGAVFAAPVLVNAAGAWGDEVATLAGVAPLGLQPKRRTALVVDPVPYEVASWPLVNDVDHQWYARPEARTRLMVSPADETDSEPCDAQADEYDVAVAVDRMQRALDLPVRRIEHRWAGLRTFTPDRGLAIGPSDTEGFFWNCGQGGYGIQTAPAAGRLLAALVGGEDPGALAAVVPLVDPRRFAAGTAA